MKYGIKYYVNERPIDWCGEATSSGKVLDIFESLNDAFKAKEKYYKNYGPMYRIEEYKE